MIKANAREEMTIVNHNFIEQLRKDVNQYDILYLFAPLGWEKEAYIAEFCRGYEESRVLWLEDAADHAASQLSEPPLKNGRRLVIIPRLEKIIREGRLDEVCGMLAAKRRNDVFVIASAVSVPEQLFPYMIIQKTIKYGTEDMKPSTEDVAVWMKSRGVTLTQEECLRIERDSNNLPLYILMLANLLSETGRSYSRAVRDQCFEDIFSYIDVTFFRTFTQQDQNALMKLSCFEELNNKLIGSILTLSAAEVERLIERLLNKGSVLKKSAKGWNFQPLLRQYLEHAIQKYLDQDTRQQDYRRAMDYLLGQEDWYGALRFAYILQEEEQVATCLERYLRGKIDYNAFISLEQYFGELPVNVLKQHPNLMLSGSILKAIIGDVNGSLEYEQLYRQYLEQIQEQELFYRMQSRVLYLYLSRPGMFNGDILLQSVELIGQIGNRESYSSGAFEPQYVSVLHGEKDLSVYFGTDEDKAETFRRFQAVIEENGNRALALLLRYLEAEVFYERNELDLALDRLVKVTKAAKLGGYQRMQQICTLKMLDLLAARNQLNSTEAVEPEKLEQIEEVFGKTLFLANCQAHAVYYYLLKGNEGQVSAWMREHAPDESERFYTIQYAQYLIKAKVYLWTEQYVRARIVLEMLLDFAQEYRMYYLEAQAKLLKAVIYYRDGKEQWKELLSEVLNWGRPLQFVRIFADEGAAVYELLSRIAHEDREWAKDEYLKRVLTATKAHMLQYPQYMKPQKQEEIEEFTASEQDVMRLLVLGEKNAEIAAKLFVSENTVKYHLKNIYQKLQVKSRSQAIHKIREYGLI